MLVLGTLVYNEILVIPIGFMKNNTKAAIEKREKGRLDGKDGGAGYTAGGTRGSDYMATSPGRPYNHGRNIRAIEKKLEERDRLVDKHQDNMMLGSDDGDFIATSDQNSVRKN